jgi:hypothetical protein
MAENEVLIVHKAQIDPSIERAAARIAKLREVIVATTKEVKASDLPYRESSASVEGFGRQAEISEKRIKAWRAQVEASATASKSFQKDLDGLRQGLLAQSAAADKAGGSLSKGGGSTVNFGTIGRSASGLGLGGLGEIANAVDDFKDLTSQIQAAGQAAGGGIVNTLSALTGIGPVGLAAGAGIVVASAALALINATAADAAEGIKAELDAKRQANDFLRTATKEQLEAEIAATQQRLDDAKKGQSDGNYILDQGFKETSALYGDFVSRLSFAYLGLTGQQGLNDITKDTQQYNAEVATGEAYLQKLNDALANNSTATNDAAEAEKKLAEERDKAVEAATRNLATIEEQIGALNKQNQQTTNTADADRRLRAAREQTDFEDQREQATAAHRERLETIEDQGNKRIEQLRAQGEKQLKQADSGILKLRLSLLDEDAKLAKDRTEAEQDYMASERAAVAKYYESEKKFAAQANTARIRRLEDLNNELLDAEEANDVVRFIQAKRRGEQDLQRMSEDTDTATQERQRQFQEERDQAAQQHQENLAQLKEAADARKADIQAQIAERQQARAELVADIRAQVEEQKAQNIEAQKAAQIAFEAQIQREDAFRKKRLDRQAEDDRIADQRRKAALDAQLADLNTKANAERQIITGTVEVLRASFGSMAAYAASLSSSFGRSSSGGSSRLTGVGSGGSRGRIPTAFAEGGIISKPTWALRGERPGYSEAEIPFRKSEGIEPALSRLGLGGGTAVNINGPISVGDGVSVADMQAALQQMGMVIVSGIVAARQGN